jgi:hypothetical protein
MILTFISSPVGTGTVHCTVFASGSTAKASLLLSRWAVIGVRGVWGDGRRQAGGGGLGARWRGIILYPYPYHASLQGTEENPRRAIPNGSVTAVCEWIA